MPEEKRPIYKMEIDLNVLQHLGINLYSNIPAVLSEAVANAWDADAENVRIDTEGDTIVIHDDGTGMSRKDINDRFLRVGYRRRDEQGSSTPKGRSPMGRKGIGKLSLFSIANTVEVYTRKDGEESAFRMSVPEIEKAIGGHRNFYEPESINFPNNTGLGESGTRIVLNDIKKNYTRNSATFLRRRLARRFSIIGAHNKFCVCVDGEEISTADRGYYKNIQYIWTYGEQDDVLKSCSDGVEPKDRTQEVADKRIEIRGWLATVKHSGDLKEENESEKSENLNRIAIYVRGKMAQEDLLSDFSERGVYASYLIGELQVDGLDEDGEDDAATSSRQRIVEDDPRYLALREIIQGELKYIQNRWTELRDAEGVKRAIQQVPAVEEWIEDLRPKVIQEKAKKWVGRLNRIRVGDEKSYKSFLKCAILGFESFRHRRELEKLENIQDENLEEILSIFGGIDELENSYYGQIVEGRIAIIHSFQNLVDDDAREKVIQKYLFDHLWLLDPSWERAKGSEYMEKSINTILENNTEQLSDDEKRARIDIKYRTVAGKHVIVELKRSSVSLHIDDLKKQIRRYYEAVRKHLIETGDETPLEIVCVLGKNPTTEGGRVQSRQEAEEELQTLKGQVVTYTELINNAEQSYADYIEKHKKHDKLWKILKEIEDFTSS